MLDLPIYLDNHATTRIDPEVLKIMTSLLGECYGNAASPQHAFGQEAFDHVEKSRGSLAQCIGAKPEELIFTNGATESNNLALKGVCEMYRERRMQVVTCVTEHTSVLETCEVLKQRGFEVTVLPVKPDGLLDLEVVAKAISDKTLLVSILMANNEIGVIQPIREIAAIAKKHGALMHSDATQAVGKIPVDVNRDGIDLMSFSSHKLYGPKGIGALYIRNHNPRVRLEPLLHGGGHEKGLRPGTLNVPAIVGFAKAAIICQERMGEESKRMASLRNLLKNRICEGLDGVSINGSMEHRLSHNLNLSFAYVEGESLLKSFSDIALSSSSACASVTLQVSYVLKALGLPEEMIHSALRFGLGRFNTEEEIIYVADKVIEAVNHLRSLSHLYQLSKASKPSIDLARQPGQKL